MAEWASGVTTGADMARAMNTLMRVVSPQLIKPVVNDYKDAAIVAVAGSTLAGAANQLSLTPFFVGDTFSIDRIGVALATAVTSAQGKCVVYDSTDDGYPNAPVLEPSGNLDLSGSLGLKEHTLASPFQFEAGKLYWLGFRHSSTATLRSIPVTGLRSFGVDTQAGSNMRTVLARTVAYANPAPNPWVFNISELVSGPVPRVMVRVSAVA